MNVLQANLFRMKILGLAPDQLVIKYSLQNASSVEERLIHFSVSVKLLTYRVQTVSRIGRVPFV